MKVAIKYADASHVHHAEKICILIEEAAKIRGTGIARRVPEYIRSKIEHGNAVIALSGNEVVGFCYIETWGHSMYVVNSGLIVHPEFRKTGLARKIKEKIFLLSKERFPEAKIFGITTSLAVMKINSDLGYKPVTFSELTKDEAFWKGCQSCPNVDILNRTGHSHCLCTGMLYTPDQKKIENGVGKRYRWGRFKRFMKFHKIKFERKVRSSAKKTSKL